MRKRSPLGSEAAKKNDLEGAAQALLYVKAGLWRLLLPYSSQAAMKMSVSPSRKERLDDAKTDFLLRLAEKRAQAETALNLALGVSLSADVSSDGGRTTDAAKEANALTTVSPGQEFLVAVKFHNGSKLPLTIDGLKLEVPAGWNTMSERIRPEAVKPGDELRVTFRLRVPKDAAYTRPYWHRDDPETESVNHIDNENYATLPFPPPALQARVNYTVPSASGAKVENRIAAVVVTPFVDEAGKEHSRPLAVVPAFSVVLEPGTQVISTHNGESSTVTVGVTSNLARFERGVCGWNCRRDGSPNPRSKRWN